ncbi:hypothetical protein [Magnetovibrio sp.]|uniref:hypothetical protein n=1 Tax=Magnetovibrio sp. TaxID=2024836 RepID=UPI002F929CE6
MSELKRYVGIDNDLNGGMTDTAKIIRDAWVFGLIPESETCEGWLAPGIEDLWRKVNAEWEKYGFLVGNLPDDIRANFMRIQEDALNKAKAAGWEGEDELAGDE